MRETLTNIMYMAHRFKIATALNLVGLIVAFATFYVLMTQIYFQDTYNKSLKDYERLYRLETDYVYNEWEFSDLVCYPFSEGLRDMAEVESYSIAEAGIESYMYEFVKPTDVVTYPMVCANSTVLSTLTDRVVSGDIAWPDSIHDGLIIPESIALDYFNSTDVIGREMGTLYGLPDSVQDEIKRLSLAVARNHGRFDGIARDMDRSLCATVKACIYQNKVRGVYEDFPESCEVSNCIYRCIGDGDLLNFSANYKCIIKFRSFPEDTVAFKRDFKQAIIDRLGHNLERRPDEAQAFAQDLPQIIESIRAMNVKFTPLKDSYFEHSTFTTGDRGYKGLATILKLVSLMVIVIAAINFLNFTLAESPMRVRSLNTRRVLGASRRSLRLSLVAECVITSVVACMLSLLLCWLILELPATSGLTVGNPALSLHWPLVVFMFVIALGVGVVAGVYPAIFATSFPPAVALKSSFGLTPQGHKLRSLLVFLQLLISMILIGYIGILYVQSDFIYSSHYGYDKDRILIAELPQADSTANRELSELAGVEAVSFSSSSLGITDGHNVMRGDKDGHPIRYGYLMVNNDYLSTVGVKVIEGRHFMDSDSSAIIINESARKQWDWLKLGDKLSSAMNATDSAVVVGVCEDIRYATTRIRSNHPFLFILDRSIITQESGLDKLMLTVRLAGDADPEQVGRQVKEVLGRHYPNMEADVVFFDKKLREVYKDEFRYTRQVFIISLICMIITLIGVFCLTMFETEYRRKEIGIRKVMGAKSREIIMMFGMKYAWSMLVAFIVAVPLTILFGWLTLRYFAERAAIQWWVFPLALILVGTVTLGTVVLQSWRTARENPVNSFKNE